MKAKTAILLVFVLTFIIHGAAFGDGGGIIPLCPECPKDVTGAYVKGYFTAAYEKPHPDYYSMHVVLQWDTTGKKKGMVRGIEKGKAGSIDLKKLTETATPVDQVHLFSFTYHKANSKNICKYTDKELRDRYCDQADSLKIAETFGLPAEYKGCINKLTVITKERCGVTTGPNPDAMIRGEVQILLYKPTKK